MKKSIFLLCAFVLSIGMLFAEEKEERPNHVPKVGSVSLGFTFNPASLASQLKVQPKVGEFARDFIKNDASNRQMFMLSQDPIAALRLKVHAKEHLNVRVSIGFSGSHIQYSEYVRDDLAYTLNPNSEVKVSDDIQSKMNSTNVALGVEYSGGKGNLRFIAGFNLLYAFADSKMTCRYGNQLTPLNQVPSTMALLGTPDVDLNEWQAAQGIAYARPIERHTKGFNQGIGAQIDMGVEYYFMDHVSIGATVTFTPIMGVWQPQTYSVYEGYSSKSTQVETYNALYSPGSWMLLYGTQNLGVQLSMNYYF